MAPKTASRSGPRNDVRTPAPSGAANAPPADEDLKPVSWRLVGSILAGFSILALVLLAFSWNGYRFARHASGADSALASERYADAIPHLLYIIRIYPGSWLRLVQLGECYIETGEPKLALEAFERSLKLHPDQKLDAKIGSAYLSMGDYKQASEHLLAALKENPQDPEASFHIAVFYMKQGEFREAAPYFQNASADKKLFAKARPYLEEIKRKVLGP